MRTYFTNTPWLLCTVEWDSCGGVTDLDCDTYGDSMILAVYAYFRNPLPGSLQCIFSQVGPFCRGEGCKFSQTRPVVRGALPEGDDEDEQVEEEDEEGPELDTAAVTRFPWCL